MMCQDQFIVIGGEVEAVDGKCHRFRLASKLDYIGGFDTRQEAYDAWKAASWLNVDNAHKRYFIVPVDSFFPIVDK